MKYHRLSTADFKTFRPARRAYAARTTLSIAPSIDGRVRAAFVVSKKVSAKAAVRNRVKRRLREALRSLPVPTRALTLVFTAKRSAADASYADIATDVQELVRGL